MTIIITFCHYLIFFHVLGKNKKPTNIPEILFMTMSWLVGVFVFAILIGDIRDIVGNARRSSSAFQLQMDAISAYLNKNKVDKVVQNRVKMWLNYTWEMQKSFDENQILEFLPLKVRQVGEELLFADRQQEPERDNQVQAGIRVAEGAP